MEPKSGTEREVSSTPEPKSGTEREASSTPEPKSGTEREASSTPEPKKEGEAFKRFISDEEFARRPDDETKANPPLRPPSDS